MLRHAARKLRAMLYALTDEYVLGLLDELSDRAQPAASRVLCSLRGAADLSQRVRRADDADRDAALLEVDGWLLDAERAA